MPTELPGNLVRYFEAQNRHDLDSMVAAFAPDAQVQDEGRDYSGLEAIRAWKADTSAKYAIEVTPLRSTKQPDGALAVTARVSGNFPGSPADLTYRFALGPSGEIRRLEIG